MTVGLLRVLELHLNLREDLDRGLTCSHVSHASHVHLLWWHLVTPSDTWYLVSIPRIHPVSTPLPHGWLTLWVVQVLTLRHLDDPDAAEYGQFSHQEDGRQIEDFDEVGVRARACYRVRFHVRERRKEEVEAEAEAEAG